MRPLRVLIVDDEPPARRRLRRLLGDQLNVEVIGEAGDGLSALAQVKALRPDVILLDIQMPGLSGIDLATALARPKPHVIFVTAHDAHAVRAFEIRALDYLVKPVTRARLVEALSRLRRSETPPQRLAVSSGGRLEIVEVSDIDWIEAADNYVLLHSRRGDRTGAGKAHLLRETMSKLAGRLDPAQFLRVHRSAMVQADRIEQLEAVAHGDWVVILKDGRRLRLSRTHRAGVLARLRGRAGAAAANRAANPRD